MLPPADNGPRLLLSQLCDRWAVLVALSITSVFFAVFVFAALVIKFICL
jgi:hypothetical protein